MIGKSFLKFAMWQMLGNSLEATLGNKFDTTLKGILSFTLWRTLRDTPVGVLASIIEESAQRVRRQ